MNLVAKNHEEVKLREVAREYRSQGYSVEVEPHQDAVPSFLRDLNYRPDLVVVSDKEKLIVEIKSRESIRDDRKLALVSKAVEESDEWKFVLVYTNPRNKSSPVTQLVDIDSEEIEAAVQYALMLASQSNNEYARVTSLLLIWSAVEAALRSHVIGKENSKATSPKSLIRDAVTKGWIGSESYRRVTPIIEKRNSAAHGDLLVDVTRADIETLAEVCREVVRYGEVQQSDEAAT